MARPSTDQRFLVTGATGFVGAYLVRRLVREGADVHVISREKSNFWRLDDIRDRVVDHKADLLDAEGVAAVVGAVRPTVVYHCAVHGSYPAQKDQGLVAQTNFMSIVNLVLGLMSAGVDYRCLVNLSSSAEYGVVPEPMTEAHPLAPNTVYGAAKAGGTLFCQVMGMTQGQPIITLRLFSAYGPYMEPTPLVAAVIRGCLADKDLSLTTGEQVRDFVYIDDMVDCMLAIPAAAWAPGEVVNVGTGHQYSVREIVEKVMALTGSKARALWGHHPQREFDTSCWVADTGKAESLLGWKAAIDIDEGLRRTIAWFRDNDPPSVLD